MQSLLVVIPIVAYVTLCYSDAVIESVQNQLELYQTQIQILYKFLRSECPSDWKAKRYIADSLFEANLDIQKAHYEQLLKQLAGCREINRRTSQGQFSLIAETH